MPDEYVKTFLGSFGINKFSSPYHVGSWEKVVLIVLLISWDMSHGIRERIRYGSMLSSEIVALLEWSRFQVLVREDTRVLEGFKRINVYAWSYRLILHKLFWILDRRTYKKTIWKIFCFQRTYSPRTTRKLTLPFERILLSSFNGWRAPTCHDHEWNRFERQRFQIPQLH